MKRVFAALFAALVLCLGTAGCMRTSADDLYALPQLSEGYLKLQSAIDSVFSAGAEYAAPSSGANRQPIQQEDLDGDGIREVIAFFNFAGSDKPLKIVIFKSGTDGYTEAARIEGEGTGIDSVSYLDMDNDGTREVAVGWQMGAGINMLSVYSVKSWRTEDGDDASVKAGQVNRLINTNYTEFTACSLDRAAGGEILVLRLSSSELTGEAEHYALTGDGEVVSNKARLTAGSEAILRVRGTSLVGGAGAILVESAINGTGYVTDILTWRLGKLANITMDENSGRSEGTLRLAYAVYCRDINSDGVIDIPQPQALPSTSENTTYYTTDWFSYYSSGARRLVCTTYSNYADAWYLVLPEEWKGKIAVSRQDGAAGERTVLFSTVGENGERNVDFLAVYTLTGENRHERASAADRFTLMEAEETIYAARILTEDALPVTREMLRSSFGVIYSEWVTGET